ncbi:MAG: hypothetical protein QF362_00235 [Candidatus Woesearchaeota archaeon]|jgi:polyhydroxyalkanoate synthesis regulator phasin|nr:hypothetical protein [Candidatus Woesearchaeota archaeon]
MIDKIKKGLLVGLGAFTWSRKKAKGKVKKFYSIGKKSEEKGEYIIDQILRGIGEDRKSVKRTVKKVIKRAKPLAKRAVKKAKPKARAIVRKAARRAKPLARRVAKKMARPKRKTSKSRKTRKRR